MKAPCKGCQKREAGCHGRCEVYQEYRKEQDKVIERRQVIMQSTPSRSRWIAQYVKHRERRG